MQPEDTERKAWPQMLIAVLLIAANMRMTLTAVGPQLDKLGTDQELSPAILGALGALPLALWAIVSPASHWLSTRLGITATVSWALITVGLGTVWRSLPGNDANLWAGTALIGAGLAIVNVLIPAVIKRDFNTHVPIVMALYAGILGGMGALAAGISIPISEFTFAGGEPAGWRFALATVGAPIPIALTAWIMATWRKRSSENSTTKPPTHTAPHSPARWHSAGVRVWKDAIAWQVSLYFGAQSAIFYTLASWYVPYRISNGTSAVVAGIELMITQILGCIGSLLLPFASRTDRLRRHLPAILPLAGLIAWLGIPLAPEAMPAWIFINGLVAGASFAMALTLIPMRALTPEHTTALSGMAQSVGYLFAALGPLLFGIALGILAEWVSPFALVWVAASIQIVVGISLSKPRFILEQ